YVLRARIQGNPLEGWRVRRNPIRPAVSLRFRHWNSVDCHTAIQTNLVAGVFRIRFRNFRPAVRSSGMQRDGPFLVGGWAASLRGNGDSSEMSTKIRMSGSGPGTA